MSLISVVAVFLIGILPAYASLNSVGFPGLGTNTGNPIEVLLLREMRSV